MIPHFFQFLGKLSLQAWLSGLIPIAALVLILVVRKYIRHNVLQPILYVLLLLILVRSVLFYNPVSWAAYKKLMPLETNDARHYDVMLCETNKYLKANPQVKYLAVGSSQTYAIYYKYALSHPDLALFTMSGLSPLDLYSYRKEIAGEKPPYVLLYLSEFDLARRPTLESSRWSPFTIKEIYELHKTIDTIPYFTKEDRHITTELAFGRFLPEYKYSFLFRDMADRLLNKYNLLGIVSPFDVSDSVYLRMHLEALTRLSAKYIAFNYTYLEKAVRYLNEKNIKVVIVEGQYSPLGFGPENRKLNGKIKELLRQTAAENPLNVFIPREQQIPVTLEDFKDGYHLKGMPGVRFSQFVVQRIQKDMVRGNRHKTTHHG